MKSTLKTACNLCIPHSCRTQKPLNQNDFMQNSGLHAKECKEPLQSGKQQRINWLCIIKTALQCPIVYTIGGVKAPPVCAQTSFLFQVVKRVVGAHRIIGGGAK